MYLSFIAPAKNQTRNTMFLFFIIFVVAVRKVDIQMATRKIIWFLVTG